VLDNLNFALGCSPPGLRTFYQYNKKYNTELHKTNFEVVEDNGEVDEVNTAALMNFFTVHSPDPTKPSE